MRPVVIVVLQVEHNNHVWRCAGSHDMVLVIKHHDWHRMLALACACHITAARVACS